MHGLVLTPVRLQLLAEWFIGELSNPTNFPLEGNTAKGVSFPEMQIMGRRLIRVMSHIYYKHWSHLSLSTLSDRGMMRDSAMAVRLSPSVMRKKGGTPAEQLQYAASVGSVLEVRSLLKEHKLDADQLPLLQAVRHGHVDVVSLLLGYGADINGSADAGDGEAPLLAAARSGHRDVVYALLMYGPDVHVTDKSGRTPLFWACRFVFSLGSENTLSCLPVFLWHTIV